MAEYSNVVCNTPSLKYEITIRKKTIAKTKKISKKDLHKKKDLKKCLINIKFTSRL